MASRILLSGASGMVGSALREAFEQKNQQILRLVRRAPVPCSEVEWRPDSSTQVADIAALEGLTAAIHLSGANLAARRWTTAYKRELVQSRVDSTRALAQMLAGLRKPPQVLLMASATGIYGSRADELLDESSASGTGFLADLCGTWEAAAQPAVQAGIRVIYLRFGVVLAAGPGAVARMLPIFRMGLGGRLGNGRQWMSWIALADLVAAVQFVLEQEALSGPVNLVAPNPVTNAEFTQALAQQLHRPAVLPAPGFALRLALGQMAEEALLASSRVVPKRLLDAGFAFQYPRIQDALREAIQ